MSAWTSAEAPSRRPTPAVGARPAARRLGRFDLLEPLGQGPHGQVWLAHDTQHDRRVALKLLQPQGDAAVAERWLDDARAVARLSHPHVLPVLEAGHVEAQAFVAMLHVEGETLAQRLAGRGPWPAREAVQLLQGLLGALGRAHAAGVVHRNLKPTNVLLGRDGRVWLADFGMADAVPASTAAATKPAAGSNAPGWAPQAPEALRGMAPTPAQDVFAFGLLLGQLLAGEPLVDARDPARAMQQLLTQDLGLPASVAVDEGLRGIVAKALAGEPGQRHASAQALQSALAAWLDPGSPLALEAGAPGEPGEAALDFLLRRMRHRSDFPALSESVLRIQRVAESEHESVSSLAEAILRDVSLTHKLLRMVNTVHYAHAAADGVTSVARAVALVGFAGIRNMALSVLLVDHMGNKTHAQQLKEEFLRALMAGAVAGELARGGRESEDAHLASMFQNLGRLLVEYYFPDEAGRVRQLLPAGPATPAQRGAAARRVLGLDFESLGQSVGGHWGLPERLLRAMRVPQGVPPLRAVADGPERLRWLGRSANALTDALLQAEGEPQRQALVRVAELHAGALGLDSEDLLAAAQQSRRQLTQWARVLGLKVEPGVATSRMLLPEPAVAEAEDAAAAGAPGVAGTTPAKALLAAASAAPSVPPAPAPAASAAVQAPSLPAATSATAPTSTDAGPPPAEPVPAGQARMNELLLAVLQLAHTALDARCAVLCLREARAGGALVGRLALGEHGQHLQQHLRVEMAGAGDDLFRALVQRGADMLVADSASPRVQGRLPPWFGHVAGPCSFLVLPLVLKGTPLGMIYVDRAPPHSLRATEADMQLLRGLRDQAVAALARSGTA